MNLVLREQTPSGDALRWQAFEVNLGDGFRTGWWSHSPDIWREGRYTFFRVDDDRDAEVARVKIDFGPEMRPWPSVRLQWNEIVAIDKIEVHSRLTHGGIGKQVVDLLRRQYPDRVLVAASGADGFWRKLGWSEHEHWDGGMLMFVDFPRRK